MDGKVFRRYLGWDGIVFGGISAGMKEFFLGISARTEQCKNGCFLLITYFNNVLLAHNTRDRGGHGRVIGLKID